MKVGQSLTVVILGQNQQHTGLTYVEISTDKNRLGLFWTACWAYSCRCSVKTLTMVRWLSLTARRSHYTTSHRHSVHWHTRHKLHTALLYIE